VVGPALFRICSASHEPGSTPKPVSGIGSPFAESVCPVTTVDMAPACDWTDIAHRPSDGRVNASVPRRSVVVRTATGPWPLASANESQYEDDIAREATGLRCYIGAPVVVDGETYGTLCFSGEQPREQPFDEDERRFVRLLTRWLSRELEREKHYEMLDAQNNRLNEFAGVLAHDLRNPLTSARGYAELVSESVDEPEAGYLETALDGFDRMETLALAREGVDVGERDGWSHSRGLSARGRGTYAEDKLPVFVLADGDVHVNTCESHASLARRWLSPHRSISKDRLTPYIRAFQLRREVFRKPGKEALKTILETAL
jgi:transposase-like protein